MPDITMCKGGPCTVKKSCYRYRAVPNRRQSWFCWPPGKDEDCRHYVKILKEDSLTLTGPEQTEIFGISESDLERPR